MTVKPDDIPTIGRLSKMTCLSGGASGADSLFGELAAKAGHQVVHWSFKDHNSPLPPEDRVILSDEFLEAADPYLKRAAPKLGRKLPMKKKGIMSLLRRNYYQIRYTDQVIAVGNLDPNTAPIMGTSRFHSWVDEDQNDNLFISNTPGVTGIQGGTAWACQMYIDMAYDYSINTGNRVYHLTFFDQISKNIYTWDFNHQAWVRYPLSKSFPMVWRRGTQVYTGIGSRELTDWGKISLQSAYTELKRLFG